MPVTRGFQNIQDILVFDSQLNENFSTYNGKHLEMLAKAEVKHFWFKNRRNKICKAFQKYVPKSARILEVGGGTGYVAEELKNLGFAIEMGDIHSTGLQYAKKRGIAKLYQFDLFNPPFFKEFDVICLFDVLEHLYDPLKAMECLKKMLKPEGMIILTVPAHQWLWSRHDVIAGHQKRFTKFELQDLLRESQLRPLHVRYFFSAILPFLVMRRGMKRDNGSPLRKEEIFETKIHPFLNTLLDFTTRAEFYLDQFLPNIAGGSLLAIAVTSEYRIP